MSRNKIKKHLEKYFKAKIILNIIEQIILNVPSPTKCNYLIHRIDLPLLQLTT